jgi:hypothetical protein
MRRLEKNPDAIIFEEITLPCIEGYHKKDQEGHQK